MCGIRKKTTPVRAPPKHAVVLGRELFLLARPHAKPVVDFREPAREPLRKAIAAQRLLGILPTAERLLVQVLPVEEEPPGIAVDHVGDQQPTLLVHAELDLEVVEIEVHAEQREGFLEHQEGPERELLHVLDPLVVVLVMDVLVVEPADVGGLPERRASVVEQNAVLDDLRVRVIAGQLELHAAGARPDTILGLEVELHLRRVEEVAVLQRSVPLQNAAPGPPANDDFPRQHPTLLGDERQVVVLVQIRERNARNAEHFEHVDRRLIRGPALAGNDLVTRAVSGRPVVLRTKPDAIHANRRHDLGFSFNERFAHGCLPSCMPILLVHNEPVPTGLYHSQSDTKRAGHCRLFLYPYLDLSLL